MKAVIESFKKVWRGEERLWKVFWLWGGGLACLALLSTTLFIYFDDYFAGFSQCYYKNPMAITTYMFFLLFIGWSIANVKSAKNSFSKYLAIPLLLIPITLIGIILFGMVWGSGAPDFCKQL